MKPQQGLELMSILGWAFCMHIKRPSLSLNYLSCASWICLKDEGSLGRDNSPSTTSASPICHPGVTEPHRLFHDRWKGRKSEQEWHKRHEDIGLTRLPEASGLPSRHAMGTYSKVCERGAYRK